MLEGRWDFLRGLDLTNIRETGLSSGIVGLGSVFYEATDIRLRDWTANNMTGPCLILNGSTHLVIDGFLCERQGPPGWAFLLNGSRTTLLHGTIRCGGEEAACADPRNDGIVDRGTGDRVEEVKGIGLGGYLVRTSVRNDGSVLRALDASGMGGRATLRDVLPALTFRERIGEWVQWAKQVLRILWTHAVTISRDWTRAAPATSPGR